VTGAASDDTGRGVTDLIPAPLVPTLPPQPRIAAAWYVLCASSELRASPIHRRVLDLPLVAWRRADGGPGVLLDRCPHRAVPLSMGRVVGGELQCAYHGWRFTEGGDCTRVPGLAPDARLPGRCATAFPAREQQGLIWVWMAPDLAPDREPFRFRLADDPAYTTVRRALPTPGSVYQVIENALDVPHTAFLHGGLFRGDGGERRPVQVAIRRWSDRCEAEFIGEARPAGLAGRLLSPSGGTVTHFDRFILPSITEVEYRIGDENHIVLNGAVTPVSDYESVMHAVVSLRTRFPGWLVKLIVQPIALRIFAQDVAMIGRQVRSVAEAGEERYVSTEIDLLGPHILALIRRAAKGRAAEPDAPPVERHTTIWL
jgi:phenylpropionate dioxygenase-like ring-hydroxylating dioxygenase large terminal subunit